MKDLLLEDFNSTVIEPKLESSFVGGAGGISCTRVITYGDGSTLTEHDWEGSDGTLYHDECGD